MTIPDLNRPIVQTKTFPIPPDKAPANVDYSNLQGYSVTELDMICDELFTSIKSGKLSKADKKQYKEYYNTAAQVAEKKCGFPRFIQL